MAARIGRSFCHSDRRLFAAGHHLIWHEGGVAGHCAEPLLEPGGYAVMSKNDQPEASLGGWALNADKRIPIDIC
jgi:hypothetical protein